jgi:probable HAF family extracellular repeat protein
MHSHTIARTRIVTLGTALLLAACQAPTEVPAPPTVKTTSAPVRSQGWPVTGLGTLGFGQFSGALDLNATSMVVGYSAYDLSGDVHAFRWIQGSGMLDLGTLAAPGTLGFFQSIALGVNDLGEVVGWSDAYHGSLLNRAFYWSAATGMVELPSDTLHAAYAHDITNGSVVIGCGVLPGKVRSQILRWDKSAIGGWQVTGLGEPPGAGGQACGLGLNSAVAVVGSYPAPAVLTGFYRKPGGGFVILGAGTKANRIVGTRFVGYGGQTLPGGVTDPGAGLPWEWPNLTTAPYSLGYLYFPGGEAADLNATNHVVGTITGVPLGTPLSFSRAFYWDCVGGMSDLGSLHGNPDDNASAAAINARDIVAGTSNGFAVIWGVTPTGTSVVPLPYQPRCVDPPTVIFGPQGLLSSGLLSRPGFDATLIDPNTVTISDGFGHVTPISRRSRPPGPPVFVLKDIKGDGTLDMQVSFSKAQMLADGTLTRQSFQLVVSWVDATGLPQSGKYPIRVQ